MALLEAHASLFDLPVPIPRLTGKQWLAIVLDHEARCVHCLRMKPQAFRYLHLVLVRDFGLQHSREVDSEVALAMFIWCIA